MEDKHDAQACVGSIYIYTHNDILYKITYTVISAKNAYTCLYILYMLCVYIYTHACKFTNANMYAQALSAESQAKLASQDAPPFGQTENGEPFFAWFSLPSKNM